MSSETITTKKLDAQTAWYRVTATAFVEGTPVQFGFCKTLTIPNGNKKRCPMVVQVTDESLLQRLRNEILPGRELRVCVKTHWETEGIPKVLIDFSSV